MTFIQPVVFMVRASSKTNSPTVLNIRKDGTIESGGKVYTASQLKDIIPPHAAGQPQTTVTIMAADDVPMGVIDDVKNELRKLESLKINYASTSSQEGVTRYMPPLPSAPTAKKPNYPRSTSWSLSPSARRKRKGDDEIKRTTRRII
jgi:hypothetical protein